MKFALDYDETFTADKPLWTKFVRDALASGHTVTFVTIRGEYYDNLDILADAEMLSIPCVFTGGRQKSSCFDADIWIDDAPEMIPSASKLLSVYNGCLRNDDLDDDLRAMI